MTGYRQRRASRQSEIVIKFAEHGSRNGGGQGFLDTIAPELAIIVVGDASGYGHPHREVLLRLQMVGAQALVIAQCRTITATSDGTRRLRGLTRGAPRRPR